MTQPRYRSTEEVEKHIFDTKELCKEMKESVARLEEKVKILEDYISSEKKRKTKALNKIKGK